MSSKPTQTSILIVEDEVVLRDAYKIVLNSNDYKVLTASNGLEAMKVIKNYKVDIMLLDVFMPIMDGITFLKNLDKKQYLDMKIIACTNLSDANTKNEVIQLGADKYVMKSDLNPDDLVELIKSVEKDLLNN